MPNALITGANRGIGLEFVRHFLDAGWQVEATCRQPAAADALQALRTAHPERLQVAALEVTDGAAVAALAAARGGAPLDLLINNAGIYGPRLGFGETDYQAWARVLAVNTLAPLRLTEALIAGLEAGERKLVVNISSKVGSIADNSSGGRYAYRSSKTALNMVVKSLSIDLAPRGITVVALHPGWVKTDLGGPDALITVAESVAGMGRVIAGLTAAESGCFFDYKGAEIPW